MLKKIVCLVIGMTAAVLITGCDTLTGAMPSAQEAGTPVPAATRTPAPTLGELEPLDAAYCMESAPDAHETEYSVLRFFPSGVVLQVTVKGQESCEETWEYIKSYLKETATDTFSHGEYQYSDGLIQFALAPAGSDEMAGSRVRQDRG